MASYLYSHDFIFFSQGNTHKRGEYYKSISKKQHLQAVSHLNSNEREIEDQR